MTVRSADESGSRLAAAIGDSRILAALGTLADRFRSDSTVSHESGSRFEAAVADSWVLNTVRTLDDWLSETSRRARVRRTWKRARRITRISAVYGWLSAEPDPRVVIVDLREPRTVGPLVRGLGSVLSACRRAVPRSRLIAVCRTLSSAVSDAPVKWAGALLATAGLGALLLLSVLGALTPPRVTVLAGSAALGVVAARFRPGDAST